MNYVAGVNDKKESISLSEKEKREKAYYKWLFDGYYGENNKHLIVKRVLPDFCKSKENAKNNKLLSA